MPPRVGPATQARATDFVAQPDLDRCRGENVSLETSMATWHRCDIHVHDHFSRNFFIVFDKKSKINWTGYVVLMSSFTCIKFGERCTVPLGGDHIAGHSRAKSGH